MAGDAHLVSLEKLCDTERGITYGIVKVGEFVPGGVPVIRGGDIRNGRIVFNNEKRVTEEISQKFRRSILKGGEIVINLIAEPGHTAIVPADLAGANVSRDVGVIALDDSVNHRYIDYCLKSSRAVQWLTARLRGSVTQKINLATLRALPIPIPALEDQNAIAHVIGSLDDRIELNRRMNERVKQMAQALFKSWFLDYDPVWAKSESRDAGLSTAVADLFPDSFQDSELGVIPSGWKVLSLDELARFLNGLALQKYPATGARSLPVIKIAQLRAGNTQKADRASADIKQDYVVRDGDILFSWSGSLECELWAGGAGALNQHLFKVIPSRYPRWVCYLGIQHHIDHFRRIAAGKATTMGHIQRHHLSDAKLAVPSAEVLSAMDDTMRPLVESTWRRAVQSRTLAALRDTLLPKLLSGEIRVRSAEEAIASAP